MRRAEDEIKYTTTRTRGSPSPSTSSSTSISASARGPVGPIGSLGLAGASRKVVPQGLVPGVGYCPPGLTTAGPGRIRPGPSEEGLLGWRGPRAPRCKDSESGGDF